MFKILIQAPREECLACAVAVSRTDGTVWGRDSLSSSHPPSWYSHSRLSTHTLIFRKIVCNVSVERTEVTMYSSIQVMY